MSTDLLFEHFSTLATAPDGIARLRELILQLAVRGKLGTQDAGDEPASRLLEKIRKEKTRLIKNGDIKRTDQFLPVDPEECQFDIPDGWQWTRLGTLVADSKQDIVDGPFGSDLHSAEYVDSGVPVIRLQNVQRNQFLNKNIRFLTSDKAEYLSRHNFVSGDIVITKLGEPVGKACIVPEYLKSGIFVADIIRIRLDSRFVDTNYITFMINSPFISVKFNGLVKGITRARVNLTKVREMVIPLPPLAEQHRIVAKVDRLMALCDELEARQQLERAGCLKLGTASLAGLQNATHPEEFGRQWAQVCDAFDLILDCPENVAVLRQTILQLAVQGRLVRQEPGDELTNKMVEKIKKEKERLVKDGQIKDDGKYDPIEDDEISFSIPKAWIWIRLEEITQKIGSGSTPRGGKSVYQQKGIPFLRSQNVWNEGLSLDNVARISKEIHSQMSGTHVRPRDILLNITGASIGRSCVVPDNFMEGNVSQHVSIIRTVDENIRNYLHYCIISPYFQNRIMDVQVGMSREGLSKKSLKDLLIPLPPLAEQHRIVAKVDALMALCDALESRLKERAGVQTRFANNFVKDMGME